MEIRGFMKALRDWQNFNFFFILNQGNFFSLLVEREEGREKHWLVASCKCPDQGSNPQPFSCWWMLQPTQPRCQGRTDRISIQLQDGEGERRWRLSKPNKEMRKTHSWRPGVIVLARRIHTEGQCKVCFYLFPGDLENKIQHFFLQFFFKLFLINFLSTISYQVPIYLKNNFRSLYNFLLTIKVIHFLNVLVYILWMFYVLCPHLYCISLSVYNSALYIKIASILFGTRPVLPSWLTRLHLLKFFRRALSN